MKGAYKQRGERRTIRPERRQSTWKRDHRRNRRLLILVLVVGALLALLVGGYLLGEEEVPSEPASVETADTASSEAGDQEEEVASGGEAARPTELLGQFRTDYAWDPDPGRQSNLKMAAGAINDTVLKPGEEFSALEHLQGLEYEPAKVFANGGVDYELGGGLCQVSSTLFMAAHYAGLEILERHQHYAELPYIRPGLDATVWFGENGWGALDMRFKNTTDGDILIREWVDDKGFLNAQIYGEEKPDTQISINSEKIEEDLSKGIKWATTKKVTENGKVVFDDTIYESVYSYNPPVPEELKHETHEPRVSGWLDETNTTNWNDKD